MTSPLSQEPMPEKSVYACKVCGKKAIDGFAIYRTSPKGGPFKGVCGEHRLFSVPEPDVAGMIERDNEKRKP